MNNEYCLDSNKGYVEGCCCQVFSLFFTIVYFIFSYFFIFLSNLNEFLYNCNCFHFKLIRPCLQFPFYFMIHLFAYYTFNIIFISQKQIKLNSLQRIWFIESNLSLIPDLSQYLAT